MRTKLPAINRLYYTIEVVISFRLCNTQATIDWTRPLGRHGPLPINLATDSTLHYAEMLAQILLTSFPCYHD